MFFLERRTEGKLSVLLTRYSSLFSLFFTLWVGRPADWLLQFAISTLAAVILLSPTFRHVGGGGFPAPEYPNEEIRKETAFCVQWRASLSRCNTGSSVACYLLLQRMLSSAVLCVAPYVKGKISNGSLPCRIFLSFVLKSVLCLSRQVQLCHIQ